jgi:hypothetical protein
MCAKDQSSYLGSLGEFRPPAGVISKSISKSRAKGSVVVVVVGLFNAEPPMKNT